MKKQQMKKLFLSVMIFCAAVISASAQKITPDDAAKHIGETVTICGKIYGGKYFDNGNKMTLLNMGAAYPKSPLTIVINAEDRKNFKNAPEDFFSNKTVCITGVVKEYKGKPQIFIQSEEDLKAE
jgi:DNA/RNA endonuclease YhcR with UshA esterase domain